MNNRKKLNRRIKIASNLFKEELDHYLNLDYIEDEADGLSYLIDYCEEFKSVDKNIKKVWKEIQNILIDVEYVKPVNIDKITVTSGKRYWFRKNNLYYDCVSNWEAWVNQ